MKHLIAALLTALILAGCNTVTPHLSVYDGLLPPTYQVKDSPVKFQPRSLRRKSVAIVTTTNFDNYTKQWIARFEEGGLQKQEKNMKFAATMMSTSGGAAAPVGQGLQQGLGAMRSGRQAWRKASDPRILVDRVNSVFKHTFRRVTTATDFADARKKKVDYIALVDYQFTANAWGSAFSGHAGVYLLDSKVRRVLQSTSEITVQRGGDITGVSTMERVLNTNMNRVLAGLNARFHPRR